METNCKNCAVKSWRIYRLPGSRENWHIDSGPGTQIVNVLGFELYVPSRSVDIGGEHVPRAWIEVAQGAELFIVGGIALCVAVSAADVSAADVSADAPAIAGMADTVVRDPDAVAAEPE